MEAARDSIWALRSLSIPEAAGTSAFVMATGSRDGLGRIFCGAVVDGGTVLQHGGEAPKHVLRGHRMALLCMDLTWLRASEAWGPPAACDDSAPDQAAAASGMACVALGSAGTLRGPCMISPGIAIGGPADVYVAPAVKCVGQFLQKSIVACVQTARCQCGRRRRAAE